MEYLEGIAGRSRRRGVGPLFPAVDKEVQVGDVVSLYLFLFYFSRGLRMARSGSVFFRVASYKKSS